MNIGQFLALLTLVSLVGLIMATIGKADDYTVGSVCVILEKVFVVLLLIGLVGCVGVASGISLSVSL